MTSRKRLFRVGIGLVAVAGLAVLALLWSPLFWTEVPSSGTTGAPEDAPAPAQREDAPAEASPAAAPEEVPVPAPPGPRLDLPDQPGWTSPPGPRDYGLDGRTFALTRVRTARLGQATDTGTETSVGPFLLAALPWKDSFRPEDDELVLAEKVVLLLREHRILSCASPVMLTVPTRKKDPRSWQEQRKGWVGIPVPVGTDLPRPLVGIAFEGGEVLPGPRVDAAQHSDENWVALVEQARARGREPFFPLIYRFSGWTSPHPDRIQVQWMLPVKPPR